MRSSSIVVLVCVLGVGHAEAKPRGKFEKAHAAAARSAKAALAKLFDEAVEAEHLYQAVGIARALVRFDPDHEAAREHLEDEKKDGNWVVNTKEVDHYDEDEDAAESFKKSADKIRSEVAAPLWDLLKNKKARKDGDARRHLIEDLAALLPDDERVSEMHLYTERDGYWVTTDIPRLDPIWRKWILASNARTARKQRWFPQEIPTSLRKIDVPWVIGVGVPRFRGWATVEPKYLHYGGKRVGFLRDLLRATMMPDAHIPGTMTFIVVDKPEYRDRVLESLIDDEAERADARKRDAVAIGKGPTVVVTADEGNKMACAMVRATTHVIFEREFGTGKESEWLHRGLSIVLSMMMTAVRTTLLADPGERRGSTETIQRLEREMLTLKSSWPALARDLMKSGELPSLASVVPMTRDQIYLPEMLTCYLVSMYALQAYPKKMAPLLEALGKDVPAKTAIRQHLGVSLQELEKRAVRYWKDNGGTAMFGESVKPAPR